MSVFHEKPNFRDREIFSDKIIKFSVFQAILIETFWGTVKSEKYTNSEKFNNSKKKKKNGSIIRIDPFDVIQRVPHYSVSLDNTFRIVNRLELRFQVPRTCDATWLLCR